MSAASRPPPQPWPMKWVVVAIVVFIAGYTFVNLKYRKAGPGHEPAAEARQRATAARLKEAGWEHYPVAVRRPVEKAPGGGASTRPGAQGLGLELAACFAELPPLFASIDSVAAPAAVRPGEDYTLYFTATVADQRWQLGEVQLYRRGTELALVPVAEPLPGKQLLARWEDASYAVTIPTGGLVPGTYRLRLVARGPAREWDVTVR